MASNNEERKDAGLSATMLLDPCPRRVILQQEEEFYESPSSYWARFRGTMAHLMMEQYDDGGEGIIQEIRFRKSVVVDGEEIEITGKMDHVDTNTRTIIDYKSIKSINAKPVNKGKPKREHEQQVSIYRWLLDGGVNMETGEIVHHEIDRAGIIYFDMTGTLKIGATMMSLEDTEDFIIERVRPLIHYRKTGELPDLMKNERGQRHPFCRFCAVKDACDLRWEAEWTDE